MQVHKTNRQLNICKKGEGLLDQGGEATGPRGRGYWIKGGGATGPRGRDYWRVPVGAHLVEVLLFVASSLLLLLLLSSPCPVSAQRPVRRSQSTQHQGCQTGGEVQPEPRASLQRKVEEEGGRREEGGSGQLTEMSKVNIET